jgi:soluble lytic murein transglycosylase-like protein
MSKPVRTTSTNVSRRQSDTADERPLAEAHAEPVMEVARPPSRRRRVGGAKERRRQPARSSLSTLRHSPVRNGLIGLAVAGTAAPIVVNRHQQALRTDPSHEISLAHRTDRASTNQGVGGAWREMEAETNAAAELREEVVRESLDRYADFDLTRDLAEEIYDIAKDNAIEPDIAFGLVRAESSFKNSSTSPVGAVGLTQLMPRTAAWLEPGVTREQLREPETNLRIGFKYLRSLIDKYGGDTSMALLAYNRGPGTVDRELKRGGNPDNGYADFVRGVEGHGHSLYTRK